MRRAAKVDDNQALIVQTLRDMYLSVAITSQLGDGFPDIVVGYGGKNYMFEIKDPEKVPSKRKLTEDERKFHNNWRGQINTVETVEDVLAVIAEELNQ